MRAQRKVLDSTIDQHPMELSITQKSSDRCVRIKKKLNNVLSEQNIKPKRFYDTTTSKRCCGGAKPYSKPTSKHSIHSRQKIPSVYKFKDIYDQNRQETLRQIDQQQREMREFHSRPVPNFSRHHKRIDKRKQVHTVTVPITPDTLLRSMVTNNKIEKMRKNHLRDQMKKPKFNFHSTAYMSKPPFQPKLTAQFTEPRPFKLKSELRGAYRRRFDETIKENTNQRIFQLYLARSRLEQEKYLLQRQMTNFKAHLNPFKRYNYNYKPLPQFDESNCFRAF